MYNAMNMTRFLGHDASDSDAQRMGEYLVAQGWELTLDNEGYFQAFRNDAEITENEWQNALAACFDGE